MNIIVLAAARYTDPELKPNAVSISLPRLR